ncbi:endothelial lipase [Callorhinchus milii]|uniref:PLAT domain-containing protein n=1 Tax=Callorhinchus milii TaxID=7868 RepID=A0A4W3IQ95_CALMI|nr:endothelial lipase [Callorhinchus milii]|eukprot:gi/632976769/ref/XP_007904979.1/ PREDICTED: endothelial lipase [Callorhinchus milii]
MERGMKGLNVLLCLMCSMQTSSTQVDPFTQLPAKGPSNDEVTMNYSDIQTKFKLSVSDKSGPKECDLRPGVGKSLEECNFKKDSKTFLIIHGWTTTGLFESWIADMAKALGDREEGSNVIVVDWLMSAHQTYITAANNTRRVGTEIGKMVEWLQVMSELPLHKVHLIGYSLGAHVAGFAGGALQQRAGKIGRITGLDPAGPMFEGVAEDNRLSPDDADFVDVLHTFSQNALGVSIGIQEAVGHVDVYPNGGGYQPGCGLQDVLKSISFGQLWDVVHCEHVRSVKLFVDSLLNQDKTSLAYRCSDTDTFEKGLCLSCRKNRCNKLGYNVNRVRNKPKAPMYLKTRADMPFRVYHYQLKMHPFGSAPLSDPRPKLSVRFHGTTRDGKQLVIKMAENFSINQTNSFLVYCEDDIGDLLRIKLRWEGTANTWSSLWGRITNFFSKTTHNDMPEMEIRKLRIKSGELQKKYVFCAANSSALKITPGNEMLFVKCMGKATNKTSLNV